jgi:hypothetical protein
MAVGHVFTCHQCGDEAGRLTVYAPGEAVPGRGGNEVGQLKSRLDNDSAGRARLAMVSGLGDVTFSEFNLDATIAAIAAGDAKALYAIDLEFVPFWCPSCHRSYCARHWETWDLFDDGFFDEKRGRCPKGHERKLLD